MDRARLEWEIAQADAFDRALAQALLREGHLDESGYEEALREQTIVGGSLSLALWELGLGSEWDFTRIGADIASLKAIDRERLRAVLEKPRPTISSELARTAGILALDQQGPVLRVASCRPWRLDSVDALAFQTGQTVEVLYLSDVTLMRARSEVDGVSVPRRYLVPPSPRRGRRGRSSADGGGPPTAAEDWINEEEFASLYASDLSTGSAHRE